MGGDIKSKIEARVIYCNTNEIFFGEGVFSVLNILHVTSPNPTLWKKLSEDFCHI